MVPGVKRLWLGAGSGGIQDPYAHPSGLGVPVAGPWGAQELLFAAGCQDRLSRLGAAGSQGTLRG